MVGLWDIMSKVRVEAFCWGAGTALGELPPYFVARAHRLASEAHEELDDEELDEFEELEVKKEQGKVNRRHLKSFNTLFQYLQRCVSLSFPSPD